MSVFISGIGVVSSLGSNHEEHKRNLFRLATGITKNIYENHGHTLEAYTGKVETIPGIPEIYKNETRNFKFAFSAFSEAVRSAGVKLSSFDRIAVCVGTSLGGKAAGQEALYRFNSGDYKVDPKLLKESLVYYIADELMSYYGVSGGSYVISTACSASNNAVILGSQLLQDGEYDIAICGGCDEVADISLAGFTSLGAINADSPCKPYSSGAGISLGEGAGFLVLTKDRSYAKYGKIIGGMITSDAYHITAPKPTGEGASRIVKHLIDEAGLEFKDIDYINGHGTGTLANDKMEKNVFTSLFPETTLISSTKGQTGHTLGAAGVIELINCLAAIEEQAVPATKGTVEATDLLENFVHNKKRNHIIKNVLNFSFAFGGNNSGILLSSLDSPLETFSPKEDVNMTVLSSVSSIDKRNISAVQYEEIMSKFNNFKALRLKSVKIPKTVNPAQFRKMDNFSKLVTATTARAIELSGINLSKINTSKIGIVFTTPSGPVDVVEGIERQLVTEGYARVSAARFPFTVMNAAAGMLSIVFKITGPLSVISTDNGAIDGIQYAKEMMRNDELDYVLLVSAHQWTDMSFMYWEQFNYDEKEFYGADFAMAQVLSRQSHTGKPIILDSIQLKYGTKSPDQIEKLFSNSLQRSLLKLGLETEDVKGFVWNSRKKMTTVDYEFLYNLPERYKLTNYGENKFSFSSNGAGEEIDFLVNEVNEEGYYLVITFSNFGGISFAIVRV